MTGRQSGFSLIELMIVITILAIMAAIVVPRLVDASEDARESALGTDLSMLRRQIGLYRLQHMMRGPHLDASGNLDEANFTTRLTERTDPDGKLNAAGTCGPYVTEWPVNPFSVDAVAGKVLFGADAIPPRDSQTGWYYSTTTCIISPNSATGGEDSDPTADVGG